MMSCVRYNIIGLFLLFSTCVCAQGVLESDTTKLLLHNTCMKIGNEFWYFDSWHYADGYIPDSTDACITIHSAIPLDKLRAEFCSLNKQLVLGDGEFIELGIGMNGDKTSGYALRMTKTGHDDAIMSLIKYENGQETCIASAPTMKRTKQHVTFSLQLKGDKLKAVVRSGLKRTNLNTIIEKINNIEHDYVIKIHCNTPPSFMITDNICTD